MKNPNEALIALLNASEAGDSQAALDAAMCLATMCLNGRLPTVTTDDCAPTIGGAVGPYYVEED